ncbi:MAG: DNA internalization-related competence protein ComEC/Rec2 [Clostridia bacterium]|nr:DNA internalization-related competence protein ComEC/Rec2 [Clostridia bacterium]
MKRPILIALIGYIIGIIWELYLKVSIVPFIIILTIINLIIKSRVHTILTIKNIRDINIKAMILLIVSILISNNVTIYLNNKYENIYNMNKEEQTYLGTIISNEQKGEYKSTYTIKIENVNGKTRYKNLKLILKISNKEKIKLRYGDKIKFKGNYNQPERQRNYRGFDYSEYLKTLKIYGTISYSGSEMELIKKENINIIELSTHKISDNLNANIKKLFKEKEASILSSILLGDNQYINEQTKESFRNSGIYHILVISGAHMSYIILGITYLLDKVNISYRKKVILKILGILFFILLTTRSISVARAGIMGIITLGASFFYRRKDIINSVCLSMLIILIYNPYSIKSISFQLSYGGVIGILALNKSYTRILKNISKNKCLGVLRTVPIKAEAISVILSAQTMIIPVMILNFHTISLTFLFANILVSYIIGIIIILGFICAFSSLISLKISGFIAIFLNIALKILNLIAKFFGEIPISKIYITTPSKISIILYYIIILCKSTKKEGSKTRVDSRSFNNMRLLIILLIITLIFNNYIQIPSNLQIYFIDVGQGDSSLIITPNNKRILIDGGGTMNSSGDFDVGEDTLLPYLLNRRIKKLDYIMISHFDADHCQGLLEILNSIKVKNIIISKQAERVYNYEKIMEIVVNKKINIMVIKRGDVINVDNNVDIKILYPEGKLYFDDINSNSIVAKLKYNKFTMLFTGDIESKAEQRIVKIAKKELKSTILKVAHHGSKTSTIEEFIEAVKPEIALIGVGKNNKFGHPNKEVLDRIKEKRSKNL